MEISDIKYDKLSGWELGIGTQFPPSQALTNDEN